MNYLKKKVHRFFQEVAPISYSSFSAHEEREALLIYDHPMASNGLSRRTADVNRHLLHVDCGKQD